MGPREGARREFSFELLRLDVSPHLNLLCSDQIIWFRRPCAKDVNAWEKLGNKGWNWENFFKYSKKSETCEIVKLKGKV